ncbi:MAG: hypothetical protein F4Y37_03320 [Caldilineaceae bacterium SB0664_bin_22]|nr:hypothetical protein [Caldilineaceae bacterium SB0664_bin_22]
MNTVVQERTRTLPNGHMPELHPDAEPTMTRAARKERIAWRREHLAEWKRGLESLGHFDPEFIYDIAHEYDYEWTTDPDYGAEGVRLLEFDEDGVVRPLEKRAWKIQERMADAAADALTDTDLEADYELEVRFRPETIAYANQATGESHPVRKGVRADLLVRAAVSEQEQERFMPEGVLRLDLGAPVPPLVLEVLSRGWAGRDLSYKKVLYEAAGVVEYLVYDLGGKRSTGSPRELLMYRLVDGAYHRVDAEPQRSAADPDEFWSDVFDTYIRFLPDTREISAEMRRLPEENRPPPRFQWWDAQQDRWRDRETDREHEREAERQRHDRELEETRAASLREGEARGEAKSAVAALHAFLDEVLAPADLERIETIWHRDGPPTDALQRVRDVLRTPNQWRSLLPGELDDNGPHRTPTPSDPELPKGR